MICNDTKTGTEGEWPPEVEYETSSSSSSQASIMMSMVGARDKADDNKPEEGSGAKQLVKDKEDPSLVWKSYGREGDAAVLRLTWYSMYACEAFANKGGQASQHWGFFTWFVILYVFRVSRGPGPSVSSPANARVQGIPRHGRLSHLRLVAELQPLRGSRLGSAPPRRHHPRRALPHERLGAAADQHGAGQRQ